MNHFSKESHVRSLLKGISWRFIAFTDTILLVWVITCFFENCSLGNALKIGVAEFLLKYAIYYAHERAWQLQAMGERVSAKRTMLKTIVWRIVATATTFLISGTVLNEFGNVAIAIAVMEMITKLILYYVHERLWLRLPLGKVRSVFKK